LAGKKVLLLILAFVAAVVVGFFMWLQLRPAPQVVLPQNLELLDPAVTALIKSKAALAQASSREASAHGDLGLVYEANHLWEEARRCFETASRLSPKEMSWKFHLAIAARKTGDYEGALELLQSLAREHSHVPYVQQHLGEALLESGDLTGAEAAFEKLIALAPNVPLGYAGLGNVMLQKQNTQRAVQLLEKAVSLAPDYRTAHYLLGIAYRDLGWHDQAEIELAKGVDAPIVYLPDPLTKKVQQYAVNLKSRLEQAEDYLSANNSKSAAQILEQALAYHPENVGVLNSLAAVYLRLGLLKQAETLLRRAQKLEAGNFTTYINLSSLALHANRPDQALQYADSAIAANAKTGRAYFTRGQALARLRRFEEALKSLQTTLQLDSTKSQNYAFAGDLYMEQRAYERARDHYQKALALNPKMLPAIIGLARAHWALGHRAEAKTALAEARNLAPDHPLIHRLEKDFK
jgi:tetratricopeptide (TPR) repeat protein